MKATIVYEDHQGSLIDDPTADDLEVRWYDGSSQLTGESFNRRQEVIADFVETCGRSGILIDAVQFGMNAQELDVQWRDANTIPRLNAAGVKKQALVVPAGFPPIGAPPAPEGPADFPTAYFATRAEARAWLAS
ncbi:MAG: hypothetical protein ACRBN8_39630 [Nannocystales bacterium]